MKLHFCLYVLSDKLYTEQCVKHCLVLFLCRSTVAAGDNVDTSSTGTGSTGDTDSGTPLTPDGNLELVDDVYQTSDGKQFITVQSKNDNTFYIVIDRDKNGENVYFLNLVDEADLMALMQDPLFRCIFQKSLRMRRSICTSVYWFTPGL